MSFCSRCGTQVKDTALFCPNCGTRITVMTGNNGSQNYNQGINYQSPGGYDQQINYNQSTDYTSQQNYTQQYYNNGQMFTPDGNSTGLNVISFLIPLVGLILYIIYHDKQPIKAKGVGKWALIGFIINFISIFIFMFSM